MALQFVIGRAGSGKSHILYKKMIDESELNKSRNYIAVVPEQYSMETQKEILNIHSRSGSFNIEVTSMTRLAYSVFEEQGVSGYKVMDDLGKTMVMRKVLEDCKKDLVIYKDKAAMPGFAEKMKMVVSEFKQYGIDSAGLADMKNTVTKKPALKYKLSDIEIIYNAFNKYIDEKIITAEDVLNIFCKYIPTSEFIKNTCFYFDGFTGFTPSQYQVMELLMKHSAGVSVAITLPDDEKDFSDYNKFELFSLSKETILKLKKLAGNNSVEIKDTIIAGEGLKPHRIRNNEELCFLEKHIFRNKVFDKYSDECSSIEIKAASNPHSEAAYVASQISYLVVSKGYRYNDIAVITGDMEGYYRYLEEEFSRYNIPTFIDHKRNISSNPFVDGIKAAIEIVEKDFSYESVFHMIRLGIMDLDRETIDLMENYVLRSGRRGFKSYSQKWEKCYKKMTEEDLGKINEGREKLLEIIKPLREELKEKGTVLKYTKAVYNFILAENMQKKINDFAELFKKKASQNETEKISAHYLSLAKEYEQAYGTIISMLDKLVSLMGDEQASLREYKQILQAGFESIKVGIIPPGLDTVMVGDIQRTRLKDTKKIIFFIGVNDGIIPGGAVSGGIITDSDREFLENNNYVLAPTARENVFKQRLYLYSLLAKPTEKICISYSKSASDGSVRRKSYLINTIQNMFEKLNVVDIDDSENNISHITNKDSALNYVAENILEYRFDSSNGTFEQLCSILMSNSEDRKKIELMADGAFYKSERPKLTEAVARRLYGTKENIGITRLERFAGCAYSQFLNNGLKLGEREKYEIAAFDIGNLYHDAINRYFNEVQRENISWNEIDTKTSHRIIDNCVEKVMDEYDNDALSGTARNLFIKKQVRETALNTVDVLVKHINAGKFIPTEYELRVEHGRIDRVDTLNKDGKIYVKVIDYKSGNKKFSISDTIMGLQMQLMVYLKDAVNYEKKKNPHKDVLPAAGLYFHIHDPYVDKPDFDKAIADFRKKYPESDRDDESIMLEATTNARYKQFRMSGLSNADTDVIRLMDQNVFEKRGSSDILPVSSTSSGLDSRSQVMDSRDYADFIEHISNMAEEMQEKIIQGDISINPIEGACTYCPYGSICRFDRKLGDKYREVEKVSLESVRELLNKKAEE